MKNEPRRSYIKNYTWSIIIVNVDFEWDPAKARINLRKHKVEFPYATRVFADPNYIEHPDEDDHEGEERWW